ncbi:MAG: FIST C-terminal domain-containing protein [Phycisphaeraceae bacterium]|nr:FIST C-terminal domain-containing protein [Phycisphaeraceae bacterium]
MGENQRESREGGRERPAQRRKKGQGPALASSLSGHLDAKQAATQVARQCLEQLARRGGGGGGGGDACDVAFMFFSRHHVEAARDLIRVVRGELRPRTLVSVSAEAVIGGEAELERQPGVSLLAMSLPGVRTKAFKVEELPGPLIDAENVPEERLRRIGHEAGFDEDHRGTILLADPFSVPVVTMLPVLMRARDVCVAFDPHAQDGNARPRRRTPIFGGMASAAGRAGGNVLALNDSIFTSGGVGVSFSGAMRIDTVLSQGCRPIGQPMVITGGKGQLITHLGGRPVLHVLSELLDSLEEDVKEQVRKGLFLGRAISEYKDRFGRDDFLIRNIVGVEQSMGAIAVGDLLRIGQTVQFHVRDRKTASEDLAMLLDAQQLHDRPAGGVLFTCNGRGTRLFEKPNHDAAMIARAFAPENPAMSAGPMKAKMGREMAPSAAALGEGTEPSETNGPGGPMPLAGFFAAGEIGPIGDEVFLHGQTACLGLFRGAE